MDPIWTLFSRRVRSQLTYWLSALGYNLRERSLSNSIYLVYFCIFWSVWAIAVFSLLGKTISSAFNFLPVYLTPDQFAAGLGQYLLVVWLLVELRGVTRRSPLIFSQEDAYLICQTPLPRRRVTIALFLQSCLPVSFVFAAGAVLLSFALVEWNFQGEMLLFQIFKAFTNSLRALVMILPLQMALQAGLWGVGTLRLRASRPHAWLQLVFPLTVLFFLTSILNPTWHTILMTPLRLPLESAFVGGIQAWMRAGSLVVSLFLLYAGLKFLSAQSTHISLSIAAQETVSIAAMLLARRFGQYEIADVLRDRQQLDMSQPRGMTLPDRPGKNVVLWKGFLQSLRLFRFSQLLNWAGVFGLSLGMFLPADWSFQMIMGGLWAIRVGFLATQRLRSDLSRWWLLRSLPLHPLGLLLAEIIPSWVLYTLIGFLALALAHLPAYGIGAAILLPLLTASAALAAGYDILQRSNARLLLTPGVGSENVPQQDFWGIVRGLVSVLIPLAIFLWGQRSPLWGWSLVSIPLAALAVWINLKGILSAYRWMG
jgi:hypothetical protein